MCIRDRLVSMAVIVFLVGGIGIMNVLFVSVKERTNEIGILKALGCSRRDILMEFLLEASCISLIGAVIGVLLTLGITPVVEQFSVRVELSVTGAVLSLLFGVLTGSIFGCLLYTSQDSHLRIYYFRRSFVKILCRKIQPFFAVGIISSQYPSGSSMK